MFCEIETKEVAKGGGERPLLEFGFFQKKKKNRVQTRIYK